MQHFPGDETPDLGFDKQKHMLYTTVLRDQKMMQQSRNRQKQRNLWDRTWKDHRGNIVLFQMPNIWLIAWLILTMVSLLAPSRTVENVFWWLSSGALAIWALLEIFKGTNYFRRVLGLAILCMTVAATFGVGL